MKLLFGTHNHQPVGNFEAVFKKATDDCYRPFIETLYNYSEIKATLHFSGALIDWLLKHAPEVLQKIKAMVKRTQLELLTGGYYEPILPIIPEQDRIGQIKMLTDFIKDYFEYEPCGCWIGERVWEPQLIKSLAGLGIKYILLDDFHFRNAGINRENLGGYYITEEQGQSLAVFPISQRLRYMMPFSSASGVIDYLHNLASEEQGQAVTIVDDGEKFGLWPGTHKWVYRRKWLEKFFQLIRKNRSWLNTQTIIENMSTHKPSGRCSLPAASYEEMFSWSAGNFRNFFTKYPEVNNLHKRMLYVSERLKNIDSVPSPVNKEAKGFLYMGQCNCPYWHGVFGGVYLAHLRHSAYKNLIHAQALADSKQRFSSVEVECFDFDQDGAEELIVKNSRLNVFIAPGQGGGIFELDYLPKSYNLLDGMTRREEAYHHNVQPNFKDSFKLKKKGIASIHDFLRSKEKGLESFLKYDSYRRLSLLDHFFSSPLSCRDFKALRYEELGNFVNAPYSAKQQRKDQDRTIILQRQGQVCHQGQKAPLRIAKELCFKAQEAQISIAYNLENLSPRVLDIVFAVEFNISPATQEFPNSLYYEGDDPESELAASLKKDITALDINNLYLQDAVSGIKTGLYFDRKTRLWAFPLETVSASEQGFERNYQQSVILPHWLLRLEKKWQVKITLAISSDNNVKCKR